MIVCPKCNKELEDGTNFCDSCGAPINESIFCPNCGKQTSAESVFCQNCGAQIAEKGGENDVPKKKNSPKKVLYACIAVAAIAVVVISVLIFGGKNDGSSNYSLYIKDKEIFYTDFSKEEPLQLTTSLLDAVQAENYDLASSSYFLGYLTLMSDDGKIMFFPDKFISDTGEFSLFYRRVNKPKEEPTKIDSDVLGYYVNDAATIVTYLKGDDGILYQYDLAKDEKEKIDSGVSIFQVSEDGNKIYYLNNDGVVYLKYHGKDKEKIDSNVTSISYLTKHFKTIFYVKEDSLYKKIEGKDKVKISSDVYSVLSVYDSGEVYFLKSNSEETSLMDYIQDDMRDADASMVYPESPYDPSWWDYDTVEEYEAAYEIYEQDYASYEIAYAEYWDKVQRDELREALKEETILQSSYTLCYYDGTKEEVISDSYVDDYSASCASDAPVVIFNAYNQTTFDKVKLSEIESSYAIREMVTDRLYSSYEQYVAVADVTTAIDQETATNFCIDSDGKTIYYTADVSEDGIYGDVYKITISGGIVQKPELYDTDVYPYLADFVADGQFMYYKDYKDGKGELYINKTKIDYDVNTSYVSYLEDTGRVVYFTDWNSDKEWGVLKIFENGKSTKVADDVHEFDVTPKGDILYLYDYSMNRYEGDLYIYGNGKAEKIDGEVVEIIPIVNSNYRGGTYNYGY